MIQSTTLNFPLYYFVFLLLFLFSLEMNQIMEFVFRHFIVTEFVYFIFSVAWNKGSGRLADGSLEERERWDKVEKCVKADYRKVMRIPKSRRSGWWPRLFSGAHWQLTCSRGDVRMWRIDEGPSLVSMLTTPTGFQSQSTFSAPAFYANQNKILLIWNSSYSYYPLGSSEVRWPYDI